MFLAIEEGKITPFDAILIRMGVRGYFDGKLKIESIRIWDIEMTDYRS